MENPLGRSPQNYVSKRGDNGEWIAGSSTSNELPSSGEISLEAEAYTSETSEHVDQSHLHLDYSIEQGKDGESQRVWPECDNLVDDVQNFPEHEIQKSGLQERVMDNDTVPKSEEISQTFITDQSGESSAKVNHVGLDASLDNGSNGHPLSRSSSTEKSTSLKDINSIRAPRSPSKGSLVSFYLTSDDEQLDHSPREVVHKLQRFSSMDSLGSQHLDGLSSELNIRHESAPYYPASRSYYAYDGSESSYDGTNGQISHPSRKDKDVGHTRTREELKRDGVGEEERSYRAMHRPPNRGISTEANRYTARNRLRIDKQEDLSRLPFPSRDHHHNLLPPHPAFNLSDKPSYSDPDKIDLLRTVWHLKDQLQRMHFNPPPYHPLPPERNMYAGQYNHRHDNARGYGERYDERRMAFSGEAAHFRHQTSCSCLHCSPQDRHYSAQLPSGSMHRKNGYSEYNFRDKSNSSSPHRDEIIQLQLREKYNTGKRHLRPVAGGSPVISCYHCSELLQLPADFLLFRKRYHQLMCNACRKILKFSFLKGTHLVPYVPDTSAPPPPSEVGDYNDAISRRNVEQPSHVESLSCSDDLDRSFGRSCSTGEASLGLPSFDRGKRDSISRNRSGANSRELINGRKMKGIVMGSRNKKEESFESAGPSSRMLNRRNVTTPVSEIEELPPLANSPLHRLMGYSTPSQVFKR